jgi:hypothetical protein
MLESRQERKAAQAAWTAYQASLPGWCAGFTDLDTRDDLLAAVASLRENGWSVTKTHVGSTYLVRAGELCRVSDHGPIGGILHASHRNVHYHIYGSPAQIQVRVNFVNAGRSPTG